MSKSQLFAELSESLHFLPHTLGKKNISLESAIEAYRSHKTLSSSALDLIMMSYRYFHLFQKVAKDFSSKKLKPAEMNDLWLLGFTLLMTRDKVPSFAIVSECVELCKVKFGAHTSGITNAFLRHADRKKSELIAALQKEPLKIFPNWLVDRWSSKKDLDALALPFMSRPESGVGGFGEDLKWQRVEWSAQTFGDKKFQAMDAGAFAHCKWLKAQLQPGDQNFIETRAAPGAKSIYLLKSFGDADHQFLLCESKTTRLVGLRENLLRWQIKSGAENFASIDWAHEETPAMVADRNFDFIVCELPSLETGSLFSKPDLLLRDWNASLKSLTPMRKTIWNKISALKSPKILLSIASVDPVEIAEIEGLVGHAPNFSSWEAMEKTQDTGFVSWRLDR